MMYDTKKKLYVPELPCHGKAKGQKEAKEGKRTRKKTEGLQKLREKLITETSL